MTTVQLRGLLRDRKSAVRKQVELSHTQQSESTTGSQKIKQASATPIVALVTVTKLSLPS